MCKMFVVMLGVLCCSLCLEAGIPSENFERAKFMIKSSQTKQGVELLKKISENFERAKFMIKSRQTKQGVELLKKIADNEKTPSAIRAKAILELSIALKSERKGKEAREYLIKFIKLYPGKKEKLQKVCEKTGFDYMKLTTVKPHVATVPHKPFIDLYKFHKMEGLKNKLENMTIDHMEFENLPLSTVVNSLIAKSKEIDPEKKGVNIVLLPDLKLTEKKDEETHKSLTLMFDDLSLGEAIRNICIAADMNYFVEKNAVVIAAPSVALDKLETKIYSVGSSAFSETRKKAGSIVSVKDYFVRRGIPFPAEARIVYDGSISRLIATNTHENLRGIEQIVGVLNVIDPQVVIEAKYIKIAKKDFDDIQKTYSTSGQKDSLWKKVLSSDKSEIIASASVMTQNGQEATIRMIKEVHFPESWSAGSSGVTGSKPAKTSEVKTKEKQQVIEKSKSFYPSNGTLIETQVVPSFGEPTELGIRLTVTPTVDPDKYTISLDAIPVIQQHVGWTTLTDSKDVKMPIIKAWIAQTQTTSYDGDPILANSFMEDVMSEQSTTRERNNFMLFYTARLVNPDGSPIRSFEEELNLTSRINKKQNVKALISLNKKLSELIIDKIDFKNADLQSVVKFLAEYSAEKKMPVNLAVGLNQKKLELLPFITLDLHDIPLLDVVKYICAITGLEFRIANQVVTIGDKSINQFDTRFYKVRNALITRIVTVADDESPANRRAITTKALKAYFTELGIPFPQNAVIAYDRRAGKLVVKNTHENLHRLDTLLRALDLEQPSVLIKCSFVSISDKDLTQLIGKKALSSEVFTSSQVNAIINSDKGKVIFSQQILSKSGEEATSRSVSETYFPKCWTVPDFDIREGCIMPALPMPEYGEATDLGERFSVTAYVSPNNYTMTLALNPQRLKLMSWSEYISGYSIDGKKVRGTIRTPKILRQDFITNIKIYDGDTLCVGRMRYRAFPELKNRSFSSSTSWTKMLGIAKGEGVELKNVFFFITARILNYDGGYMHEKSYR